MELSSELISQFARITNDEPTVNEGSTVYATYRLQGESAYVQIDGSDTITPVATTAGAKSGDRVTVLIKDHKAIVTGNLTDPSANTSTVENLSGTVGGLGTLIDGASRVATDYIEWKTGTGLIIGNQTSKDSSGNIVGSNVLIHSQGVDIRDGKTILAQYTDDYIYLGYGNTNATISMCGEQGSISLKNDGHNNYFTIDSIGSMRIMAENGTLSMSAPYSEFYAGADDIYMLINKGGSDIGVSTDISSNDVILHGNVRVTGIIRNYATISQLSNYYTSGDNIYANKLYVKRADNISGDPNARLAVSSPYQLGYSSGSSRKFKHDIKPIENAELDPKHLYDIEVVQFKYNDDYLEENDQRYGIDCIGFIAEQVNEVYPIAADRETGEPRNWEMRYIIPPMLALVQQQKKKIDELESRINELESKGVA